MSFFDDGVQSGGGPRHRRPPPSRDPALLTRRLTGLAVAVLVVVLAVVGIRGCMSARKDRAIKDYVAEVTELVQASDETSKQLFGLLSRPGKATALKLEESINSFRAAADEIVQRAQRTDHPDRLDAAQRWLVSALEFRRDALREVADQIPAAYARGGQQQVFKRIAGELQLFLASDVIYSQRFMPDVLRVIDERDLSGEIRIPGSRSLPDLEWLNAGTIATRLSAVQGERTPASGTHGLGLVSVTAQPSGATLAEGEAATLPVDARTEFEIQVQNQGENEEVDVRVGLRLTGAASINLSQTIARIDPGETKAVTIPLSARPSPGPATLTASVKSVPGEQTTDNNKARYSISFEG